MISNKLRLFIVGAVISAFTILPAVSLAIPLTITKQVRNVTQAGAFAATATGKPGDILEYQIIISNPRRGNAQVIYVTDTLDANTTFIAGSVTFVAGTGTAVQSASTTLPVLYVNAGTGATATTAGSLTRRQSVTFTYRVTIK